MKLLAPFLLLERQVKLSTIGTVMAEVELTASANQAHRGIPCHDGHSIRSNKKGATMRTGVALVATMACWLLIAAPAMAQSDPDCGPSLLRDGRLVPIETETGLRFSGEAGAFISEPFELPEGTVLYASQLEGAENAIAQLVEAPRSEASGGGNLGTIIMGQEPIGEAGVARVYDAGEFVVTIDSDAPWFVELEY